MASLGLQTVYRALNEAPDTAAERAFLPDPGESPPLCTYESQRPAADFPLVAFSVAYELELSGLFTCLAAMGLAPMAADRGERDPLVLAGGPLTFSNPRPLAPFCDAILVGEVEGALEPILEAVWGEGDREARLGRLAEVEGCWVPSLHGEEPPPLRRAEARWLPARAVITTPESALPNMFLVEVARGCSRACTFCVMRRRPNDAEGGMRVVPEERILAAIPATARRVGLVGAAVCDHPRITDIVRSVVGADQEIGLSSLRADRLTPELVGLLAEGGVRTLTVAADGASERLRAALHKRISPRDLLRAAELTAEAGIPRLKIYALVGLPDETDDDLAEMVDLAEQIARAAGPRTRTTLAVAPLVPKLGTPLADAAFVGIREADRRMDRLRRALEPRVTVRAASARWAWVEERLAQGGPAAGLAALEAWRAGGRFSAYKRAFAARDRAI